MEKKEKCTLVKELLPIYCDDAVGEESKQVIEKHLEECVECNTYKNELETIKKEDKESLDKAEDENTKQAAEVSKKLRRRKQKRELLSTAAFVLAWICLMWCFQMVEVSGISMEPSYHDSERLIMNRAIYHIKSPKRGDVVTVAMKDMTLLKRVVGEPGDVIDIKDSAVFINGKKVKIEGEKGIIEPGQQQYPITLGDDEYFVMGDNVEVSLDSRSESVGTIKRDMIKSKLLCRFLHF